MGIGTTSPTRTFHSKGASGISTTGKFEAGGSQVYIQLSSTGQADGDSGYIGYDSSENLTLFTGNTERLRIDSSGNVGIGTSSPSGSFVVSSSGAEGIEFFPNNFTNGNAIQHYDRSSSVYSSVKHIAADHRFNIGSTEKMKIDSSGHLNLADANIANGGDRFIYSYKGGTSGQVRSGILFDGTNTLQRFYVGQAEKMRLDASGNLIIGTTSSGGSVLTAAKFSNGSEAAPHFRIHGSSSTYTGSHWLDGTAYYIGQNSSARALRLYSGAETAGVALAASGTSWGTFSDERLKYDIEPIENAVETLSDLRTVKYRLEGVDEADSKKKLGLVAQDLVGVLDEVIDPLKRTGDDTEYMSVRYTELVPVLVKAIQEQQDTIESLTARVEQLENN